MIDLNFHKNASQEANKQFFVENCIENKNTAGETTSSANNKQSEESQASAQNNTIMAENKISANASQIEAEEQFLGNRNCGKGTVIPAVEGKQIPHSINNTETTMEISEAITGINACENETLVNILNEHGDYKKVGKPTPEVSEGEVVQLNDGNPRETVVNNGCNGKSFVITVSKTAVAFGILAIVLAASHQSGSIKLKSIIQTRL